MVEILEKLKPPLFPCLLLSNLALIKSKEKMYRQRAMKVRISLELKTIKSRDKLLSKKQPQLQIQVHNKHSNTINKNKTKKN